MAVADGVGGAPAGEVASKIAVVEFVQCVLEMTARDGMLNTEFILEKAMLQGHAAVLRAARDKHFLKGMGTTLTVAYFQGSDCYVGHVGDSRCYLMRRNEIRLMTSDQSVEGRLQQCLGQSTPPAVATRLFQVESGDRLLLCCDGLTGSVPEAQIMERVARASDPKQSAEELVRLAVSRGGTDDTSACIAVFFDEVTLTPKSKIEPIRSNRRGSGRRGRDRGTKN